MKKVQRNSLKTGGGGGRYDPFFMGQRCVRITRGFGYWCFKPQVILQSLRQINENDILIYADIGCEFVKKGRLGLLERLKELENSDIMGFSMHHIEKTWTKNDIFKHFGVQNNVQFTDSGQIAATVLFMKKSPKTLQIITEWLEIFKKHWHLVDDNPSSTPNDISFKENRHDQSIWSILNKKYKLKNFDDFWASNREILYGMMDSRKSWDTMGHLFDFNGKAKFDLSAKIITSTNSKTLKRFLYIGGRILPSKKARKQCRAWLSGMR